MKKYNIDLMHALLFTFIGFILIGIVIHLLLATAALVE
jgi:hypothetical protein